MAYPIDTSVEKIGQLYVGYFGRAADPDGLSYWVGQLNGGMSLVAIANSFAQQPEAKALYAYLAAPNVGDPDVFISAIYQDLFNRGPDAAGLAYWHNQLVVQGTPPGQMVLNIISGAVGADKTTVENKTHVAVDYAKAFVDGNVQFITIDNTAGATALITPVTDDPATVAAAETQIAAIVLQEQTNPANIQLSTNLSTIMSGGGFDLTIQADPSQANKAFQYTLSGISASEIEGGQLSANVVLDNNSKAVVHINTLVNVANLNTPNETVTATVGPISTNVTLIEGTQTVTQTDPLVPAGQVNEGSTFNFAVATTNVAPGSAAGLVQTYTITGPGLAQIPVGERSGTVTLDSDGNATVTIHTLATIFNSVIPDPIVIVNVQSDPPINVTIHEVATEAVSANSSAITQGTSVTFTVKVSGVVGTAVEGTVQNWTLTGTGVSEVLSPLSGTVTLDSAGAAVVTVDTNGSFNGGPNPLDLTFNLFGNNGASPSALLDSETITLNQLVNPFILTLGTDAGPAFTGNPGGNNQYFALANNILGSTLGQNDDLHGNSNVPGQPNTLFLTTSGILTLNVNSFSTHDIQIFNVNVSNSSDNGTRLDMSSAVGVQTVLNQNSSGTLQLLNVQNQIVLDIRNPSDLGNPVDVGLQYVGGQLANVNASPQGQVINLDPTVSPITGMPNTIVNAPGVRTFTINSNLPGNGNNSAVYNGLAGLNQPLQDAGAPFNTSNPLGFLGIMGPVSFVLGGYNVNQVGAAFTENYSSLDLTSFNGIFYTVGDTGPGPNSQAITYSGDGNFYMQMGKGGNDGFLPFNVAMEAYYSNPNGSLGPLLGGTNPGGVDNSTITSTGFGTIIVNMSDGMVMGQAIRAFQNGAAVEVNGPIAGAAGGFISDLGNGATSIRTNSGQVAVHDFNGGLGSVFGQFDTDLSFILTNSNKNDGGFIDIHNVNGGINLQISSGIASAQIQEAGNTGNMFLDFAQPIAGGGTDNTGFHGNTNGNNHDIFNGGVGTNSIAIDPTINNNTSSQGEGVATNINNLILESDVGSWTPTIANINGGAGSNPTNSFGLAQLGNGGPHGPINVFIGGNGALYNPVTVQGLPGPIDADNLPGTNFTFTGAVHNELFVINTQSTGTLNDTLSLDFGGTTNNTVNVVVQGNAANNHLTVSDYAVNDFSGNKNSGLNNPISRLNFTSTAGSHFSGTSTTLTLDTLNSLTTLFLFGTSNLIVNDTATQAATITLIDGTGNDSNVDITGLMTAGSTQNPTLVSPSDTKYLNAGSGLANALAAGGGTIHLGLGSNKIAVAGGDWNITSDGFGTTIVVNPTSGDIDTIHATGGGDVFTVGANNGKGGVGGGGQVSITAGHTGNAFTSDGNLFVFDTQGLPQFTSSNLISAGNGTGGKGATGQYDKIQIINGPLAIFDAGFTQVTGVEQLQVAAHFSNHIELNFNADNNAKTNQTGMFEVITGGGGFIDSSTFVNAGAGFNHPLLITVGALAGGDGGGDSVTTHLSTIPGSNPLTVHGTSNDLNVSFLSAAKTVQGDNEGIFATTTANNTLEVVADNGMLNAYGLGTSGINGVQNIVGKFGGVGVGLSVWLVNDGIAAGSPEVVNLSAVSGNTLVIGTALTKALNIDGGLGGLNTLLGGSAKDTITGHGTGTTEFYGYLGADTLTLSTDGGGIGGADVVIYNSHLESTVGTTDLVQNFHGGPGGDTFSFNPAEFVGTATIDLVGPSGGVASYADALTWLNPLNPNTQAVLINTGGSTGQLWLDVDHDQNLNAADYVINMTFASPPFLTSANFGTAPPANITFTGSGPVLVSVPSASMTIPAWQTSGFNPANALPLPFNLTTANFIGMGGSMNTNTLVHNYDFSALLSGVTATTQNFNGGSVFGKSSILGSKFDDEFRATAFDISVAGSGLTINGDGGTNDQLTLRSGGTNTITLGPLPAGGFNPVINVETLNLDTPAGMTVSFSAGVGQAFTNINGRATNLVGNTINTKNMVAGGIIDLSKDGGADIVNLGANLPGSSILLNGKGTVNMNFSGALTTSITGLLNLDQVVLNAGDVDYNLSGAMIKDVTQLDMRQANLAGDVTLNTAQVGGLAGFTKILIDPAGNSDLFLAPGGDPIAADFTNVALSTTNFELHVGSGDTVRMLPLQLPLQGIDGPADQKMALIFTINNALPIVMNGSTYNDLGSVSWQTGILSIDNTALVSTRPHGITELHGNNSSTLRVTTGAGGATMDLSNLTKFDGIKTMIVSLDNGSTLRMNSDEMVAMNSIGGAELIASGALFLPGANLSLVIDAAKDYDLSSPITGATSPNQIGLTQAGLIVSGWTSVDFDGDNTGGLTIKITDNMLDQSGIVTVLGDTSGPQTDTLIVFNHNSGPATTTDLSDITTFDGFQNVSVKEQYSVPPGNTFHVNDVISTEAISNSGKASIDLNNVSGDTAWLQTSTLSAQTLKGVGSTGFNTDWDITGFNAGNSANHSILKVTDVNSGNGGVSTNSVSGSLFINSSAGITLDHTKMNVINTNVATSTNLLDLGNNGNVETALSLVAGLVSDGRGLGQNAANSNAHVYVILQGSGGFDGQAGIYEVNMDTTAGKLTNGTTLTGHTNDFSVNLIGIIHTPGDSLQNLNFA